MKNSTTMQDIAERAGVSRRTVSDVLNNKKSFVSAATRERVRKIAEELEYRPNYFAKSLKEGKTQCIGLLSGPMIADFRFPDVSDTVSGIELAMARRRSNYSLMIFGANYHEGYDETIDLIKKGLVDGLLIMIISLHMREFEEVLLPVLRDYQIPFVVIHSQARHLDYHNIGFNATQAAALASGHLASLGYKDIKYYVRMFQTPFDTELFDGFKAGLTGTGLAADDANLLYPYADRRSVLTHYRDAYDTAMHLERIPEAIVASNDQQAIGLLRGFTARGIRVPHDVAIVGINGANPDPVFTDELTQVYHPFAEKTMAAVNMLHDLLEGTLDRDVVQQQILEPELRIRVTCGSTIRKPE